jgi:Helix-turn-helix domain
MSTNTKNQTNRILRYLRTGNSLTPMSALTRFKCMRLAARIEELRDAGIKISSRMMNRGGKRFACYSLA